jgi:hypothetical protein
MSSSKSVHVLSFTKTEAPVLLGEKFRGRCAIMATVQQIGTSKKQLQYLWPDLRWHSDCGSDQSNNPGWFPSEQAALAAFAEAEKPDLWLEETD